MGLKTLGIVAKERGSYDVSVVLMSNEDTPVPVVPVSFYWTWTDLYGSVVNSRQKVQVTGVGLASTVVVKLDYADLIVTEGSQATRVLTVQGTYIDSDGDTRHFSDGVHVLVDNLTGIQVL
jgi:hypothetical protein